MGKQRGDKAAGQGGRVNRRTFLATLALAGAATGMWKYWPEDGLLNPCVEEPLPGVLPLFSIKQLLRRGYLQPGEGAAQSVFVVTTRCFSTWC
jgi:hypothetical protein